ncbi:MAG: fimbrial protein [Scandinavium sp.]|uniref:fimbrial protein n=1 Tax=Scandinavium sp. TaxID=2830653 RepID=UPI003F2B2D4B
MKHTLQTFCTRAPLALAVAAALLPSVVCATTATETLSQDGQSGMLYVSGVLTESTCRLDMASAHQEISLGQLSTNELKQPGDETASVAVQLNLHDCVRRSGSIRNARTGTLLWGDQQPVATVSFIAPANEENPKLVKITGAKGFGLRIVDQRRRPVQLGSRSIPLYLSPGENQLTYYVSAQRTAELLEAGAWQSQIGFRLNYD